MTKKYFFFDIDGTLTDRTNGQVVESAQSTIKQLQENGHFVAIATGRAYYKTKKVADLLGIKNIVSNGGKAIVIDGQLVENAPLDHEKACALIHQAEELGYGVIISPNDSIDVFMNNETFIKQVGYRKEPTRYFYEQNRPYESLKNIYKIYIAIPRQDEHLLTLKDTIGHLRFVEDYITFQHDAKDEGIEKTIDLLKANNEDIVVFGDDFNDLVMFKEKWTSIAMGDACQELKDKATYITDSSVENGIRNACLHYGWIKE